MKANVRVFRQTTQGWDEVANFTCENPILPLKGDAYRGPGVQKHEVTEIEHSYVQAPVDQGGVMDNILIYVE